MITIFDYNTKSDDIAICDAFSKDFKLLPDHKYWIDLEGAYDEDLKRFEVMLDVHQLTFEDVLSDDHHPKMEEFEHYLFFLLRCVNPAVDVLAAEPDDLTTDLNIFFGKNFIITAHSESVQGIVAMRSVVQAQKTIWKRSMVHMMYRIIDNMGDAYIPALEKLDAEVDRIVEQTLIDPEPALMEELLLRRRQLMHFKRIITPQREIFNRLSRTESTWYERRHQVYFRDIFDHFYHLSDMTETIREELENAFTAYSTLNSNKLNEIMKTLTVFASIILPLTFITGLYGMNFKYMPELDKPWGYPAVLIAMFLFGAVLVYFFKRKKWL